MDVEASDFQEWEVLHNSDDSGMVNSSDSVANMKGLEGIEADSEGIIRPDYFSLDSHGKYLLRTVPEGDHVTEEGSVESDNLSWIDPGPGSEAPYPKKESGEFWSDSGSDRSDEHKVAELDAKKELDIVENDNIQVSFDGIGEIVAESENSGKFWSDSGGIELIAVENAEMGVGNNANLNLRDELEFSGEEKEVTDGGIKKSGENENVAIEANKLGSEEEKRSVVWWKLPLECFKYCSFRISPVWTFSVAATVMSFLILGRHLYKMKRKSRNLPLKVTVDDKKVSQFMSRAARLNEAFSVVKRVPIIRPTLPAAGVTPWPVMGLR